MRVLYLTRDFTTHDHRFLSSLAGTGFEVFFLRLERSTRQLEDRPLSQDVKIVSWRGGKGRLGWNDLPAMWFDLRRVLNEVKPDVLHAGPIQSAAFLAALSGFHPLVSMSWGSDLLRDADSSRVYRWMTKYTLHRSDVLLGDCDAVRRKAMAFGVPGESIYLFPWGVDLNRFTPEEPSVDDAASSTLPTMVERPTIYNLRERLGWQDQFVLLSLRSWEPIYGVDVMLRGFARAAQQVPQLRLLMLGSGSQASLVHQIIQDTNLSDRVFLGGQVSQNDLPWIYRAADLYVSASHSDGSSVSLLEALACGRPVLVSDIPGNLEWVVPGEQGWLFADGDDRALTAGILNAVGNHRGLAEMGRKARALAEERADWQKNFKVMVEAYHAAVRRHSKK